MRQRSLHRDKALEVDPILLPRAERPVDDERRDEEALARCGAASRGDTQDTRLVRRVAHDARRRWAREHDTHGSQHSDAYVRLGVVGCERLPRLVRVRVRVRVGLGLG